MTNTDSFERIVSYFHALCTTPFKYKNKVYEPYDELVITDAVFRSYSCEKKCGACCMNCTLVWDSDVHLRNTFLAPKEINGVSLDFWVDKQSLNKNKKCQYLNSNAECTIYPLRPLPCRFELFRFIHNIKGNKVYARVGVPGRVWALSRVDGEKGGLCKILPYDKNLTFAHISDLLVIKGWMDKYGIGNDIDSVVSYLVTGPHRRRLVINRKKKDESVLF